MRKPSLEAARWRAQTLHALQSQLLRAAAEVQAGPQSLSEIPLTEIPGEAGPHRDSELRAYGALILAIAGISWSAIFVRWAGTPGAVSAFYRVLIAAAVLIPWRLAARPGPRGTSAAQIDPRRARWIALAGGVFFALDLALWNTAVMATQAAIASLLGNLTPVFVGLLSWMVLGRSPLRSFWVGVVLALIGCVLIVSAHLNATVGAGTLVGDALATIASLFFAAYLLTTERVRVAMDTLTFNTLAIVGSLGTLLVICLAMRVPLTGYASRTWLALAGLGLISQLGAYYALVYALGHLPATVTSVSLLAQVPATAILAMLLLGEPLSAVQIAGSVIVLAGIYIVNRMDGPPTPA
jgi:drug/metabolite transporter (DMT)-like permease